MRYLQVGDTVRVDNSSSSSWGERGTVTRIVSHGSFDIVTLDIRARPEDRELLMDFSENEISEPLNS